MRSKECSILVDALHILKLLQEDDGKEPIIVSISDYKTSDSRTIKDREELIGLMRRMGQTDHVTHLKKDKGTIYLDIKRGGAIREDERVIEEQNLTGKNGYNGIYILDAEGIRKFYKLRLRTAENILLEKLNIGNNSADASVDDQCACAV